MIKLYFLSLFGFLSFGLFAQNIIYVQPNASGDGQSPSSPINLQAAIDIALLNGVEDELRLSDGTYSNTPYTILPASSDNMMIRISGSWDSSYENQSLEDGTTEIDANYLSRCFYADGENLGAMLDLRIEYLTISNGYTDSENGAGIYVNSGTGENLSDIMLTMNHVAVYNCVTNISGSGGGMYINGPFDLSDCTFNGNEASNGGAIFSGFNNANAELSRQITNSFFSRNLNYGNQGSTIYTNTKLFINGSTFLGMDNNASSGNGSCIYGSGNSNLQIDRCRFEGINILYWASAIQSWNGDMVLTNSLFLNNKAGSNNGYGTIAYYHNNSADNRIWEVSNCTFIDNVAQTGNFASAIHFRGNSGDELHVSNSLFWGNGTTPLYKESGMATISHSLSEYAPSGFTELTTTLTSDPAIVDVFTIGSDSPCLDAGDVTLLPNDSADLLGGLRNLGSNVDIGCFELNLPPENAILSTTVIAENNEPGVVSNIEILGQEGDYHLIELATGNGSNDADNGSFSIDGTQLSLNEAADYESQNEYYFYIRFEDSMGFEGFKALTLTIADVNEAPVFTGSLDDQEGMLGESLNFSIDVGGFSDEDAGDMLSFSASLQDGNELPGWLSFDSDSYEFSGTPVMEGVYDIRVTAEDLGGLIVFADFTLNINPTSISEFAPIELKLYPNPVMDVLNLELPGNESYTYLIFDAMGREILGGRLQGMQQIPVNLLGSGVYVLRVTGENKLYQSKFIKASSEN